MWEVDGQAWKWHASPALTAGKHFVRWPHLTTKRAGDGEKMVRLKRIREWIRVISQKLPLSMAN